MSENSIQATFPVDATLKSTPETRPTRTRSSGSSPKMTIGRSSVLGHDFRKLIANLHPGCADFQEKAGCAFFVPTFSPFPALPGWKHERRSQ